MPSRWRRPSGVLAFLLSPLVALAVPTVVSFDATNTTVVDTWVASSIAGDNGASNILTLGGAANREIFLRFRVNQNAGTGTPLQVKLRLYQKNNYGSDATIEVYAANNRKSTWAVDWPGSIEWADRPAVTGLVLASATSRTTAGYLDFVLPGYISGPGDYSFRIRTGSTLQHNFDSSEGINPPRLEMTVETGTLNPDSAYYLRSPVDILIAGDGYRNRYELANPTVGTADVESIGYLDVTKQPYGAKSDGSADATWAIQRAVNEARDARVALYFPSGTYKVSRTLQMVVGSTPDPHEFIDGIRWSLREFPCVLLGSRTGTRPKIVVDTGSSYFNSATAPEPVLRFWSRHKANNGPEVNEANTQYNQCLDNIDVDLSGKVGAIGIDMDAAQGTILVNSTITATNGSTHGYAGIFGGTGPGGYTYGVTVTGGQYGGRFEKAHCPLIINSKFSGQTVYSLYHENRGPMTLVGVEISGKPIKMQSTNSTPWLAALNVIDSRIETIGGGLLIDSNRSVSLTNAYLKNGSATAAAVRQTDPVGGTVHDYALTTTGWRNVKEYAFGVNIAQQSIDAAARVPYWINGTANATTTRHSIPVNVSSVPAEFTVGTGHRHAVPASPQFSATDVVGGVINARTTSLGIGPIGEGFNNNAARLNALINVAGSRPIFIPRGEYPLEGTVAMLWNTRIFGVGQTVSVLRGAFATGPMIQTGDAPGATCMLADLKLLLPTNSSGTASMLWWRAGENSTVKNVGLDHRPSVPATELTLTVPLVQINASGGGKWTGFCLIEGGVASGSGRFLEVSNTTQKLKFYMLNIEHCAVSPQAKFTNADNFDIYQTKAESISTGSTDKEVIWFESCSKFRAFGFGGIAEPAVGKTLVRLVGTGNSNYMLTQIQGQQTAWPDPDNYWRLIDEGATNGVNKVRGDQQTVLYKRGSPPNQ